MRGIVALAAFVALSFSIGVIHGQQGAAPPFSINPSSVSPLNRQSGEANEDSGRSGEAEKRAEALNKLRQKEMTNDTVKLLALANELKTQVDKTNEDILSLDVIRKAEQIEKLAHSVRDKMKETVTK